MVAWLASSGEASIRTGLSSGEIRLDSSSDSPKKAEHEMAIALKENPEGKLLEVVASGKLSADDYENFEPAVEALIEQVGKINVLFIMHDFHGWDLGAVWEDIKFATKHCTDIHKIAMVGESDWEKWMSTICKPFTMSSIKYFEAGQEAEARQWLAEA
jgi:hypothetical protein